MAGKRATKSGLSRDISMKINAKYSPELASECLMWIWDIVNENLKSGESELDFNTDGDRKNFSAVLHDGLVLARLANALEAGAVPDSKLKKAPKLAFKQMELIDMFITVCRNFGVPDHERFQTVDLYEDQNLHQVVSCLQSLGRKAKGKGLHGFGPNECGPNPRTFSEDVLRAGEGVIGLQMGTNKGASQAGMNFGKTRSILD